MGGEPSETSSAAPRTRWASTSRRELASSRPRRRLADLPTEIHRREARLGRIEAARAALEEEARAARAAELREQAERARSAAAQSEDERERAVALARAERRDAAARAVESGCSAAEPVGADEASAGPGRLVKRGGEIEQAYNGQIAVDGESQIIVAQGLSNQAPDTYYLVPMLERVRSAAGALPEKISVDAGFWAPSNAAWCEEQNVDAYIATQRHRRSAATQPAIGGTEPAITPQQETRAKGEWALICSSHNVRELWAARRADRLGVIA